MKYCQKCGQQIHDDAVICIHCGCSSEGVTKKDTQSPDYYRLEAFKSDANSVFGLGIISLVLCMGIGLIFQIINLTKIRNYNYQQGKLAFPELNLTSQKDIYEYESAKKKFQSGATMTGIGFAITIILLFVLLMVVCVSSQL